MSLSSKFAPGTLFRARLSDDSKHYTAVLLKNGKVLEVKNPDTGVKSTFDNVELWQASHPDCLLEVDPSKGSGIVISSDTNGFNYPTDKDKAYHWIKWVYSIVGEGAPQLLTSEEFKTVFNEMVELCTKHKQELYHWDHQYWGKDRYSPYNLKNRQYGNDKWAGYPGYFYYENYYYAPYSGAGHKRYSTSDYNSARNEIIVAYKKIYDIVHPVISDYITKKQNILKTQYNISQSKASIKRLMKKKEQLQNSIKWYESTVVKEVENLQKYETELITAKTASL